jgi:hypothetical protein
MDMKKTILRGTRDAAMIDYIVLVPKKSCSGLSCHWILAVLLAIAWVLPGLATASCPGLDPFMPQYDPDYYSVSKELARSQYVIVGRVIAETWLSEDGKPKALQPPFQDGRPRPWGFDPYMGAVYDVKVLRVIKGELGPQL